MGHPNSPIDREKLARMYDEALPQEDHAQLLSILYGEMQRELPQDIIILFFFDTLLYSNMTSKMYLNQINCLVEFLKDGGDQQNVTDFHALAKSKLRHDDWPLSDSAEEWKRTWRMIYMMLGFEGVPKHFNPTFSIMAETFFGRSGSRSPTRIGFSLDDLMNVDLRIQPTEHPYEHLEFRDGTVKVLRVKSSTLTMLFGFSTNKVAGALGIEYLGDEILSSYNALIRNYRDAVDPTPYRVIMEPMGDLDHATFRVMMESQKGAVIKLLSQRVIALQLEIQSRNRWWNSFTRDLSKQSDVQRLIFYGAVLAVPFGILALIQTIFSVWSVVLTYRTL